MADSLIRAEKFHSINGVPGRMPPLHKPPAPWVDTVYANQTWISERRPIEGYGKGALLQVKIRFDDNCRNGHQTFAITAEVREPKTAHRDCVACGCLHDDVANVFPELAPLIKWHLMGTDGPMYYVANTVYHASDRDHNGRAAGDPSAWEYVVYFGDSPVSHRVKHSFYKFLQSRIDTGDFQVVALTHDRDPKTYGTHYTFAGFGEKWHDCPFSDERTAQEWANALNTLSCRFSKIPTQYSEGKKRELNHARGSAVWPDATDAQLCVSREELTAALLARLPALMAEFRADMDACGFEWSAAK